ncbi:MAG TPA: PadR family transcriptional regulator [Rhodobacteraceae bacterium]|nr:PadR family transcriptional regulator [Paracoccaceae bacterium]
MLIKAASIPILGLLTVSPMSGYDLKKTIDISLNFFWAESFGQLYPQLKMLKDEALIELLPQTGDSGREKKTYKITEKGRGVLAEWILQNPVIRPQRDELLLKMFFATEGDPSAIRDHCVQSRSDAEALLQRYVAIDAQLRDMPEDREKAKYWRMTLKLGISQTQNYIRWCDDVVEEFEI